LVTFTFPCNEHTSGDWLDCMKFPSWSSSNYMQGSKDQVNVRRNKKTFWVLTHSIIYISKIWMKRDLANKMHISAFNTIFLKILRIIFSFSSTSAVWLQRFSQTSIRLHNPNGIKWHYVPNIIFITYQNSVICCVLSIGSSPPPETQTSSTWLTSFLHVCTLRYRTAGYIFLRDNFKHQYKIFWISAILAQKFGKKLNLNW
jgi:hypothetical protein